MRRVGHFFIRVSAFFRKEVVEVMRQPRLMLLLVVGPFLILLLFGIGFRNQPRALRTLFVVPPGGPTAQQIRQDATSLGPQLIFEGITQDEASAKRLLRQGKIDLVVVVPAGAYQSIQNNQQVTLTLYYDEVDPFEAQYVQVFGRVYVDEMNRRLLQQAIVEAQKQTESAKAAIEAARADLSALSSATQQHDQAATHRLTQSLDGHVNKISAAVAAGLGLVQGGDPRPQMVLAEDLTRLHDDAASLTDPSAPPPTNVAQLKQDLDNLDAALTEFQRLSPQVLVSPLRSQTQTINSVQPTSLNYFAPSVLVLLLQHVALTLAALSVMRERWVGTTELFRVSPVSAAETLLGKYLSYMLLCGLLAVVLTLLLVYGLGMPMLGDWSNFAVVIAGVMFASLGVGFVISLLVNTVTQAVQFSMMVLLTSVFFSGVFLRLDQIWGPVRVLSWALPTTYGVVLTRDITLYGRSFDPLLVAALIGIGIGLALVSWLLMRRSMSRNQV
jgi:ABC-2 type transport system permease protein